MAIDFLSAVLPTQGKYCTFVLKGQVRKNLFVDDLDNLYQTNIDLSEGGSQTYFALATFDDSGTREAAHAQEIRAFFMDLDCGEGKAFPNKKAAVAALVLFLQATGLDKLGTPWLVDSGGGVHVYWPLLEEVPIAVWKPIAEAFKRAAKQHAFPIDMTVTADAARVLRQPGTWNYRYDPPRQVVLRSTGDRFDFEDIAEVLKPYEALLPATFKPSAIMLPGVKPKAEMSQMAKALANNSVTWFKKIIQRTANGTGCNQIGHYMNNAQEDGMEPLWRGVLSIAKFCEDGEKASVRLSALHPYDEDRRLRKMAEIKGPYPCTKFESENPGGCEGCQHRGKITNPLALGTEQAVSTERVKEEEVNGEQVKRKLPTPPRGFVYGREGGVYYEKPAASKDEEKQQIMLTNYDLYITRSFREGAAYAFEYVAEKRFETVTFAIAAKTLTDPKALAKELASNNIIALGGAAHDAYLTAYVRACANDFSAEGRYVTVPARLGWQEDGSFAVGNTVISAQGRAHDYTFQSERLSNVIEITQAAGTLEAWRKIPEMLQRKARRDPNVWGHCALLFGNFAAPLMHLGPDGARACTVHIASKSSGVGKTFASLATNSIWGRPSGLKLTATTSTNTLFQRAGLLGTILLHVDEVTDKTRRSNGEYLPEFFYGFSEGVHKLKGSATGNAEIAQNCMWTGLSHVSSNEPQIEAMMGARAHTSHGEVQRVVEWMVPRNWKLEWTQEERDILLLLETNYGVAGRKYIRWVIDNMELVKQRYQEVHARWVQLSGAKDNERFWTNTIVSHLTAVILCNKQHAGIVDMDFVEMENWWLQQVQRMRKIINSNMTDALDILNAYTREYAGNFIHANKGLTHILPGLVPNASTAKGAIRGRVETEVQPGVVDHIIEIAMLKRHCASLGFSYIDFVQELKNSKGIILQETIRNLLKDTGGPPLRVKCLLIRRSSADVEPDTL